VLQIFGNVAFIINLFLIGAYTGAIIGTILVFASLIMLWYLKKAQEMPVAYIYWIVIPILLSGLSVAESFIDILPVIAALLLLFTYAQKKEKNIRRLSIVVTLFWIPYNIYFGALFPLIGNIIFLVSTVISILRYDLKKTKGIPKTKMTKGD